jgi:hypothetical protein
MTHHSRSHKGRECCHPCSDDPAEQPYPPGCSDDCGDLPTTNPPELACPPKWEPDPCCHCPTDCSSTPKCLEDLIDQQTADMAATNQAAAVKDELTQILDATKKGFEAYTRDFYDNHIDLWLKLDCDIAELLRTIDCKVDCWKCVLECYVCPLLADLHRAEILLYKHPEADVDVDNLYDLQFWLSTDLRVKERRFNRINAVVEAWKNPADGIKAAIDENRTTHDEVVNYIGKEPGRAIYDVFLKLVPLHLAIAPPRGSCWTTRIDRRFTDFCDFGDGPDHHCCGPNTGRLTVRERLVGPQPHLIDPCSYHKVICCLMEKRWKPAKDAFNKATSDLNSVNTRIQRIVDRLNGDWQGTIEAAAKAAIPSDIECCEFEPHNHNDDDDCGHRTHRHHGN